MSHKKNTLLFLLSFIAMTSFGQTVQEKIDKAAKDPKTEENAAKADVYLHRHNIGADTLKTTKPQPAAPANKKKKKACKKSSK